MVVDPLQVRGLPAQTWTVIHQLAVNFARRKIDERHFVLTRFSSKTYSTRVAPIQTHCTRLSRPISGPGIANRPAFIPQDSRPHHGRRSARLIPRAAAVIPSEPRNPLRLPNRRTPSV